MRIKHRITIACMAVLAVWAVSAHAADLRFTTQDFPPFSYEKDGAVSGPAAEIISEACRSMGVTCEFSLLPWGRAQDKVKTGQANGMFVIGRNPEREGWLYFSLPVFRTEYGFFVRDDNPLQYKAITDVKGYTVGVFGPSNTSKTLEDIKGKLSGALDIDMTPDDVSALKKVSVDRINAVFSNRDVGHAKLRENGITNVRYAGAQETLEYYIGFSKAHTDAKVVERFNAALREMAKDGRLKKILDKYKLEGGSIE